TVLETNPGWRLTGGTAWLALLCRRMERLHTHGIGCGRLLPPALVVDPAGTPVIAEPLTVPLRERAGGLPSYSDSSFAWLHPDPSATPPEILSGGPCGPAGDVFQAAVLLHRVLRGRAPFGEGTAMEIFNRSRAGRAEPLPETGDPALVRVAAAALAPLPEDRPRMDELAAALEAGCGAPVPPASGGMARYSAGFPVLFEIHEGSRDDDDGAGAPHASIPGPAERDAAIAQLDALLRVSGTRAPAPRGRRILPWIAAFVALALLATVLADIPFSRLGRGPSSRVPESAGRRTHAPASPHGAVLRGSPCLERLPAHLRSALEAQGLRTRGEHATEERRGPDCRAEVRTGDSRFRYEFSRCRNLSAACRTRGDGACLEDPGSAFRVLYGPDGAAAQLQEISPAGEPIRSLPLAGP
ncbi:MAG: hypothetical protein FJ098_10960, partial [Deltaproteobacteria bacterium]|nr:hypothetical protein [Deltaproteobacteria bacterium]